MIQEKQPLTFHIQMLCATCLAPTEYAATSCAECGDHFLEPLVVATKPLWFRILSCLPLLYLHLFKLLFDKAEQIIEDSFQGSKHEDTLLCIIGFAISTTFLTLPIVPIYVLVSFWRYYLD